MRIGCLQFAPQVGDVNNNMNRADAVLSKAAPEELDLLVLPELAFSGYNFKSLQEILPFLEPSRSGISSLWARTMALKYDCTVVVGYPEKVDVAQRWPTGPEYYNSAIVVNADGETIANYRKSFLYYTDETWALEGNGFYNGWIPGAGKTAIGICMDINPYRFEAPWSAYEFAFHILEMRANLVVVSMAWITRDEPRQFSRMPNEPDLNTLTYWVARLEPVIRAETEDEIIVVFCNRTGTEDDATYAGTSAVIGVQAGEVRVYGLLGRGQKELLVVDTSHPPFAKLVHRNESGLTDMAAHEADQSQTSQNAASVGQNISSNAADSDHSDIESPLGSDIQGKGQSRSRPQTENDDKSTPMDPSVNGLLSHTDSSRSTAPAREEIARQKVSRRESSTDAPRKTFGNRQEVVEHQKPSQDKDATATGYDVPARSTTPVPLPSTALHAFIRSPPRISPTAVRPKLIIPQVYPNRPKQLYPESAETPVSAASATSTRSAQSMKSDNSEASTMTIRSNPRPPEDSTPYPYSGAPLSGYPANYSQQQKRIYGGSISIQKEGFTPITTFDDVSPVSFEAHYRQCELNGPTPVSAGGFSPIIVGRKPQPFPWPELEKTPLTESKYEDSGLIAALPTVTDQQVARDWRDLKSFTPVTNGGYVSIQRPHSVACSPSEEKSLHGVPMRPTSPKFRNASRSRIHERSNSAQGRMISTGAVGIQAKSVVRNGSPIKRSASTKPLETRDIPIVASPSLLESPSTYKGSPMTTPVPVGSRGPTPLPQSIPGSRSRSSGKNSVRAAASSKSRPQSSTRAISRDRKAERDDSQHVAGQNLRGHSRSSSTDSTRNELLHRRVRQNKTPAPTESVSSLDRGRHSRRSSQHRVGTPRGRHRDTSAALPQRADQMIGTSHGDSPQPSHSTAEKWPESRSDKRVHPRDYSRHGSTSQKVESYHEVIGVAEASMDPNFRPRPRQSPMLRPAIGVSCGEAMGEEKYYDNSYETYCAGSPLSRSTTAPTDIGPPTPKPMRLPDGFWSMAQKGDEDIEHLDLESDSRGVETPVTAVVA